MTKEFKKIYNHSETRYILETTSGATGSSAIGATPGNLLRELQRRISELKDTVKVPTAKPRNPTGMGSTPGRGTQKHQPNQRQKSRDDKKLNGEGVLEDEDAIKAFLSKGGQVQQGRYHKPRKSEKTNYGSRHIGTGKSGDISGVAANTRPDSKPVVSVENDQEQDHEISMASSELQSITKDAAQLLDMVRQKSEEEGLEAWQQSKITKAADFMNSVLQSLSGDEQGVAEGSGPQKGDPVYYGSRLVGWFLGYSKYGKVITEPNYDEMGDEYANRNVYWDKDAVTIKSDKQGVAEADTKPGWMLRQMAKAPAGSPNRAAFDKIANKQAAMAALKQPSKKKEEGVVEVFKEPSKYEIYDTQTNKTKEINGVVIPPITATDLRDAAIKADDYLESQGISGRGLRVRSVRPQGVAEGYSELDELKDKLSSVMIKAYNQANSRDEIIDIAKPIAIEIAKRMGLKPNDEEFKIAWSSVLGDYDLDTNFGDHHSPADDYTAQRRQDAEDQFWQRENREKSVAEAHPNSKIYDKCWTGYRKVPGKKRGEDGSCKKIGEDAYLESLESKLEELKKK
jgi:hypothetical protein